MIMIFLKMMCFIRKLVSCGEAVGSPDSVKRAELLLKEAREKL